MVLSKIMSISLADTFLNQIRASESPVIMTEELAQAIRETEGIESLLATAIKRRYLLHGSPFQLSNLKPMELDDYGLLMVHATQEPQLALWFATTNAGDAEKKGGTMIARKGEIKIIMASKNLIDLPTNGYVYLLKRRGFSPVITTCNLYQKKPRRYFEWMNPRTITPLGIIPVVPSDLTIEIVECPPEEVVYEKNPEDIEKLYLTGKRSKRSNNR